jgi:hypothetical protein
MPGCAERDAAAVNAWPGRPVSTDVHSMHGKWGSSISSRAYMTYTVADATIGIGKKKFSYMGTALRWLI